MRNRFPRRIETLSSAATIVAVFALIVGFLLSYYHPSYLFLETITAGGDMCSQYLTAHYYLQTLLPALKVIGWMPGNYAGFALFQFYFPLPFLLMAALELVFPLQVAFKLVSAAAPFLLPFSCFACLRLMRFSLTTALLAAVLSLNFLFMEANAMWGGNIPSTLAGEFSYGIGLALLYVYLGTFFRGVDRDKWVRGNALLLALVGFSHGYTILFGVCATALLLFTTNGFGRKVVYYLKVNTLAFFLLGFWIVQLLWFTPYTTSNNFIWIINSLKEVLPPILWPAMVAAFIGLALLWVRIWGWNRMDRSGNAPWWQRALCRLTDMDESRIHAEIVLWVWCTAAVVFYLVAHRLGVIDIRFLPFLQLNLMLLGAVGLGKCLNIIEAKGLAVLLVGVVTVLWVNSQVTFIQNWIQWDYTGFEKKVAWKGFKALNDHLAGDVGDPRVVYEHNDVTAKVGSLRAFEMLPLFSGRSTLEGLYPQSSPTAPFVFYIQSEISATPSRPLPHYSYSHIRIGRALEHLRLFNVSQIIAAGDKLKRALAEFPEVVHEKSFPPFSVYRYTQNVDRYVTLTDHQPVLMVGGDWKQNAYRWFRIGDLSVPVIFKKRLDPEDRRRFQTIYHGQLPDHFIHERREATAHAIHDDSRMIQETLRPEEILFTTPHLGKPHLIRVSYHPNWKVEGAERIYLVSPSFMLVYPNRNHVRLYFGATLPNHLGRMLTAIGLMVWVLTAPGFLGWMHRRFPGLSATTGRWKQRTATNWATIAHRVPAVQRRQLLFLAGSLVIGAAACTILLVHNRDATIMYNKGMDLMKKERFAEARAVFGESMAQFPGSSVIDDTSFFYGITFFKEKNWEAALDIFEKTLADFPDARNHAEILFHIGKCQLELHRPEAAERAFRQVMATFSDEVWAKYAEQWLQRIPDGAGQ